MVVAVWGTVLTVGIVVVSASLLVISVLGSRKARLHRPLLEAIQITLHTVGVLAVALLSGVGIVLIPSLGATIGGLAAGIFIGRSSLVTMAAGRVYIRRDLLGAVLLAIAFLGMQLTSLMGMAGPVRLAMGIAWFSVGMAFGSALSRRTKISIARSGLALIFTVLVLASTAVIQQSASAQEIPPLRNGYYEGTVVIPDDTFGISENLVSIQISDESVSGSISVRGLGEPGGGLGDALGTNETCRTLFVLTGEILGEAVASAESVSGPIRVFLAEEDNECPQGTGLGIVFDNAVFEFVADATPNGLAGVITGFGETLYSFDAEWVGLEPSGAGAEVTDPNTTTVVDSGQPIDQEESDPLAALLGQDPEDITDDEALAAAIAVLIVALASGVLTSLHPVHALEALELDETVSMARSMDRAEPYSGHGAPPNSADGSANQTTTGARPTPEVSNREGDSIDEPPRAPIPVPPEPLPPQATSDALAHADGPTPESYPSTVPDGETQDQHGEADVVSDEEIKSIVDWGIETNRSIEDIQEDLNGLSGARGGAGEIEIPAELEELDTPSGKVTAYATDADSYRAALAESADAEASKNHAQKALVELGEEQQYWSVLEQNWAGRWIAGLDKLGSTAVERIGEITAIEEEQARINTKPDRMVYDKKFDSYDQALDAWEKRSTKIRELEDKKTAVKLRLGEELRRMVETSEFDGKPYRVSDEQLGSKLNELLGLGEEGTSGAPRPRWRPSSPGGGSWFNRAHEELERIGYLQDYNRELFRASHERIEAAKTTISEFERGARR